MTLTRTAYAQVNLETVEQTTARRASMARPGLEPEASRDGERGHRFEPGDSEDGETRTRTGDTTIFSRVLYQLSYLAVVGPRC
jgi:hypothetical protein